jgi:hypothetical protein
VIVRAGGDGNPVLVISSSGTNALQVDQDDATERSCYHRRTTSDADKERLCALFGGGAFTVDKLYEAYVLTWINVTNPANDKV